MLERRLTLDSQVALRPEPFGALAYHYGNRRLVFLKHPDLVRVVEALADHPTVADTLGRATSRPLAGRRSSAGSSPSCYSRRRVMSVARR